MIIIKYLCEYTDSKIFQDKEILENAVKELGGKLVSDSSDIAPTVTHLICGKLVS